MSFAICFPYSVAVRPSSQLGSIAFLSVQTGERTGRAFAVDWVGRKCRASRASAAPVLRLSAPRAAEAALRARARLEGVHDRELGANDRDDDELRETLQRLQRVDGASAIPAAHHQLPLIVRIDQADEVSEHDAV